MITVPIQTLRIDTIQTTDQETHLIIEKGIIPTIEIGAIQTIEINIIKTTDQGISQTTDQIIKDPTTITIKIYHEITHKIGILITIIDKEIIPNPLIEIITVTQIPTISLGAIHQNIKGKLFK